jgi:hypothetical protein
MRVNPFILLLSALTVLSSCKKSSNNSFSPILMTVKEYKTNIPLAGVNIRLYKCTNYDNVFGCQSKSIFATHVTDQNGKYAFTSSEFSHADEGIFLSKLLYWDMGGGDGERFMEPEAIVSLTLTPSKTYPDTSMISLKTTSEYGNTSFKTFEAPKDSTFNYIIFGNEKNKINWTVYTKDLGCYQFCIVNMLDSGSLTLNPQRFETLNSSIEY